MVDKRNMIFAMANQMEHKMFGYNSNIGKLFGRYWES